MINRFNRKISLIVVICLLVCCFTSSCDLGSKHVEKTYDPNDNSNIQTWDDNEDGYGENNVQTWDDSESNIQTWDEIDDYTDWVYSAILYDNISTEMPIIECQILDYRTNGDYFDGELVYNLVNDKFDVNSFVAKYAIGTGVIVICVILNVATAGGATPICCFIAGAAKGAVKGAIKGAAFGGAIKAVIQYLKTGSFDEAIYGALEGSSEGYMWGAIFGAITGGWNSRYCFAENTPVKTNVGIKNIQDLQIGDVIYAYDESSGNFVQSKVTQVYTNQANELVTILIGDTALKCTPSHTFYTNNGWKSACDLVVGDRILSSDSEFVEIQELETCSYTSPITTYNICVDSYHTYLVGNEGYVTHNGCNVNKYKDQTIKFDDPENFPEFVNPKLAVKYPNGVYINPQGYPDFTPYALPNEFANGAPSILEFSEINPSNVLTTTKDMNAQDLLSKCLSGDEGLDLRAADKIMKELYPGWTHPKGYTWHHSEDCRRLILAPSDLHSVSEGGLAHNGGASLIRQLLNAALNGK